MFIGEITDINLLYHVTLTDKIDKIKQKGILPLQTSNWVQAGSKERYGNGEIFAFENIKDAIRWAAKWDWELNKTMGSGKISIITFKDNPDLWKEDDADPIGRASSISRWFKKHGRVKPEAIQTVTPVTLPLIRSLNSL